MQEQIVTKIKGHEKFVLRAGWLTKGLLAVDNDARVFSGDRGADILGVGSNMVKAIRYYLQAFNLVTESSQKGALLNDVGKIIADCDPYIEDYFTLCLLHLRISMNREKATTWYLIFNQKEMSEFSKEELLEYLKRELFVLSGKDYPEGSIKDDIDVLLNMYGKDNTSADPEDKLYCPLANLGLIGREGDIYFKKQPEMKRISSDVFLLVIAILMQNQKSISIDAVGDYMEKLFNISWVQTNEILDVLDREETIHVDRTAGLDMIYPLTVPSPLEVIKNHYKG